jgi:hypothetical protein
MKGQEVFQMGAMVQTKRTPSYVGGPSLLKEHGAGRGWRT